VRDRHALAHSPELTRACALKPLEPHQPDQIADRLPVGPETRDLERDGNICLDSSPRQKRRILNATPIDVLAASLPRFGRAAVSPALGVSRPAKRRRSVDFRTPTGRER
jgi:hypothetical protein